jgi:isochorismate synthase
MIPFLDKIKKHKEQNLPFVVYRKPNSDEVKALLQENDNVFQVNDFTEVGFVFTSFDGEQKILMPADQSVKESVVWIKDAIEVSQNEFKSPDQSVQKEFETLVSKGIQAIQNQEFKKVVVSRRETVEIEQLDIFVVFSALLNRYPTAFVYLFSHPKVGIWLGATPEKLLYSKGVVFNTIALAGTQKDLGFDEIVWEQKEIEEQEFVTDYIVENLQTVASQVVVSESYSVKAGGVWHIKTDISGVFNLDAGLREGVELLHPTPAVCGYPKESSKAFIFENENYDRGFYTGYLGELNEESVSDLYVNLRCMQIEQNSTTSKIKAYLYMGCGITKDSIAEKEWSESVNKAITMKKVL